MGHEGRGGLWLCQHPEPEEPHLCFLYAMPPAKVVSSQAALRMGREQSRTEPAGTAEQGGAVGISGSRVGSFTPPILP